MTKTPWDSLAEQRIREAQASGEFDNLPGFGKPIPGIDEPLRRPVVGQGQTQAGRDFEPAAGVGPAVGRGKDARNGRRCWRPKARSASSWPRSTSGFAAGRIGPLWGPKRQCRAAGHRRGRQCLASRQSQADLKTRPSFRGFSRGRTCGKPCGCGKTVFIRTFIRTDTTGGAMGTGPGSSTGQGGR